MHRPFLVLILNPLLHQVHLRPPLQPLLPVQATQLMHPLMLHCKYTVGLQGGVSQGVAER